MSILQPSSRCSAMRSLSGKKKKNWLAFSRKMLQGFVHHITIHTTNKALLTPHPASPTPFVITRVGVTHPYCIYINAEHEIEKQHQESSNRIRAKHTGCQYQQKCLRPVGNVMTSNQTAASDHLTAKFYGCIRNRENAVSGGCLTIQRGIKDHSKRMFPVFYSNMPPECLQLKATSMLSAADYP